MEEPVILRAHVDDALDLYEVPAEDILAGDPQPRSKVLLHVAGDATRGFSGVFSAEPGTVRTPLAAPETFHVLSGTARLDDGSGASALLNAGDVVVLGPGLWIWTFETAFRAVFAASPSAAH